MNNLNEGRPCEACLSSASSPPPRDAGCLGVRSLVSTPAYFSPSSHTEQSQHSQQQPPFAPDPLTPGPADFNDMPPNLTDHHADLKGVMRDPTTKESEGYRHGQINVFRQFPRFDQGSRPIVSDNWRAKSAAKSAATGPDREDRPQLSSLMTENPAALTPTVLSPSRSPLLLTSSHDIPGFSQQTNHHNPPPTPVSLSTPINMVFPFSGNYSPSVSSSSDDAGQNIPGGGGGGMNFCRVNKGFNNSSMTSMASPMTPSPDILGYCFTRPDGSSTRLVPVDMLPFQLEGIPPRENNNRLMPLPVPTGVGSNGRSTNTQPLFAINIPGNYNNSNNNGVDAIQSTIDRIIAASPSPPASSFHPAAAATGPGMALTTTRFQPQQQQQQQLTTGGGGGGGQPKRMKIYCDKWVHEGVCAFTQQGCKYKHEMPHDRATQHALGLFMGLPAWWRRRQAELSRVMSPKPIKQEIDDGTQQSGGAHPSGGGGSRPAEDTFRAASAGPGTEGSSGGCTTHPSLSLSATIPVKRAEEVRPILAVSRVGAETWNLPTRPAKPAQEPRESSNASFLWRNDYNIGAYEAHQTAQYRSAAAAAPGVNPSKGASAWPWHHQQGHQQQHYARHDSAASHKHIQIQTEQRAQSHPVQRASNLGSACAFQFHPMPPSSPGPSPYGPIAPPPPRTSAGNNNNNNDTGGRTTHSNY